MNDTLQRDVNALRGHFAEKGWTQGTFYDDQTDEYCLIGGINKVMYSANSFRHGQLIDLLADCLPEDFQSNTDPESSLVDYNDTDDRTFEEITALIDCAIEKSNDV